MKEEQGFDKLSSNDAILPNLSPNHAVRRHGDSL